MPTVWFIRHGESISNANLRTKHPAQSELTPKGVAEAARVVTAFDRKPDLIVVSEYVRTWQTAVPTIEYFKPIKVEEWPVYEFTYLHPERYNGTTGSERGPVAHAYWDRNDPFEKEMAEGESFAELMERVEGLNARLREQTADFIAVFTHGLFVRAFLWMWLVGDATPTARNMNRYRHFIQAVHLGNTAIVKTVFPPEGPIQLIDIDTTHLTS